MGDIWSSKEIWPVYASRLWRSKDATRGSWPYYERSKDATSSKCIASSNKCLTSSNKKLLGAPGIATRSKDATRDVRTWCPGLAHRMRNEP